jgi:tubulin monoglycylase TTLL3/8
VTSQAPSTKKKTTKKADAIIKESKNEDAEDDDEYADDDFTMEDGYGEEEDDDEDDEGFKSPTQGSQVVSKEDSKQYPYMNIVLELLSQLKKKYPQYDINGYRNTWILKPGGKSRGRGIKCFRSYEKMMQHIRKIKAR